MEIRVQHGLEPDEAHRRIVRAAAEHGVEHAPPAAGDPARAGSLRYETPLGSAEASYAVERVEVVVRVTDRPAFVPEGMVRRAIESKLGELLDG